MADLKQQLIDFGAKIGLIKSSGPASSPSKPKSTGPKFDFNKFIAATQTFWETFFKKSVPYFFKNIVDVLKKYPDWLKGLKKDELASHLSVYPASLFIILALVFLII